MDDDIIRILIGTDNHLGYLEKDAVRSNDSFAAFNELLGAAKSKKADLVLLGGDVFHENKPSRRTMYSAIDMLRKHCTGYDPVYIEVLNDQSEIFSTRQGKVNYEDPYYSISLPVFSIHGNHDDPSREAAGCKPLAAMDMLAVSNLINYFGQAPQVDNIEITPILIRKASTLIAIYGLGAIRDERLNRMWTDKKVKFVRPAVEQGRDDVINIFVLHQNRDYGRGVKNCIHESMIPEWMDLVVWGNEHECQPCLNESLVGTFRIYQPGSSVACSLVEGESNAYPKHMGMLEVRQRLFRLITYRFKQVRVFKYADIRLADIEELDAQDPKIEQRVKQVLVNRITEMIQEAQQDLIEGTDKDIEEEYKLLHPHLVLIRLRVDHTGFPPLNQQRFGSQFLNKVANPSSLLLFTRKKSVLDTRIARAVDPEDQEAMENISIEDLVKEGLQANNKQLGILSESDLAEALENFVMRKNINAISEAVCDTLLHTQTTLFTDLSFSGANKNSIAEAALRVKESQENTEARLLRTDKKKKSNTISEALSLKGEKEEEEEYNQRNIGTKGAANRIKSVASTAKKSSVTKQSRGGSARATSSMSKGRSVSAREEEEEEEEEMIDEVSFSDDDDDDVSSRVASKSKSKSVSNVPATKLTKRKNVRAVTTKKKSYKEESEDEIQDDDDDDDNNNDFRVDAEDEEIHHENESEDESDEKPLLRKLYPRAPARGGKAASKTAAKSGRGGTQAKTKSQLAVEEVQWEAGSSKKKSRAVEGSNDITSFFSASKPSQASIMDATANSSFGSSASSRKRQLPESWTHEAQSTNKKKGAKGGALKGLTSDWG